MWECNLDAVGVFQLCAVGGIGHMGGITWMGIEPSEIHAACALLRQPRARWPALASDVVYMGRCVAEARNKRAEAARG